MHSLKPKRVYRIVSIQIAVPAEIDDGDLGDGISEMMTQGMMCDDAVYHDWGFKLKNGQFKSKFVVTTEEPEEGELF